ncbi:MAG: DUF1844 domain-containing protein [Deltaproteobacteria bacterium]|jgi:hypothetical protein|nr:DUF1844 domain-containing protein [Deltaproteobacteria bacterium]
MSEITVNDRRLFGKDGQVSQEKEEPDQASQASSQTGPPPRTEEKPPEPSPQADSIDMGGMPVSIGALFLDLTTSAFLQMGEKGQDGQSLPNTPNLPAAKQLVDLLGVLEQKTKGNLTSDEEALLKALLYDARLKYVSLTTGKRNS